MVLLNKSLEAVTELAVLKPDLSLISPKEFKRELGPDKVWYYKVDFDIVMTLHSAHISFAFVYRGKMHTQVNAEFIT
jgi:hypothetical protein